MLDARRGALRRISTVRRSNDIHQAGVTDLDRARAVPKELDDLLAQKAFRFASTRLAPFCVDLREIWADQFYAAIRPIHFTVKPPQRSLSNR